MNARLSATSTAGFDAITLENDLLRAVILPTLGGRIWELEDKLRRRQWIWHRTDVPLQAVPPGTMYDDVWAGGWEELFPNDAPCSFEGNQLPDHGEWWTMPWAATDVSDGAAASARLTATTSVIAAACSKTFRLSHNGSTLSVAYTIRSLEQAPFHFLFKQHLPLAIHDGCRLALPGGKVRAVDTGFGTRIKGARPFEWPVGQGTDLSLISPAGDRTREFVYVSELSDAWCGVDDNRCGASLRMRFDATCVPYVWLFLTYGGWRNLYTAVLEPCTNMPKDLAEAVRMNQSARLDPGAEFTTTVAVTLDGAPS